MSDGEWLSRVVRFARLVTLAGAFLAMGPAGGLHPFAGLLPALADDDGDDGDGDDDGGGGGGGGGGSGGGGGVSGGGGGGGATSGGGGFMSLFGDRREPRTRRARRPANRAVRRAPRRRAPAQSRPAPVQRVALPERARNEIVAIGLSDDALATLAAGGYTIVAQDGLARLATTIVRLSVPDGTGLDEARAAVRALDPAAAADFNHFYRPVDDADPLADCSALSCTAARPVSWPATPGTTGTCGEGVAIGLVDTGINPGHEALAGTDLEILPFDDPGEGARRSSESHGTAVAALILATAASRAPGLLPDARVVAVDAFVRHGVGGVDDDRASVYRLVRAMDRVTRDGVSILNLSLAGPRNDVLARMVGALSGDGVVIVASAGNGGARADPVYPAGYEGVIAVTAVDHRATVYRRAGRGAHVDIAAPGVDVWTAASVRGVKPKTGTSYAAPFVSAAVALLSGGRGVAGHDAALAALAGSARDIGPPGRDETFGHGLLQAGRFCLPGEEAPPPSVTAASARP